jgi:hypothetical protein
MDFRDLKFITVGCKSKVPLEKGWTTPARQYSWGQINAMFGNGYGGNVGVVAGVNGLVVLDLDNLTKCEELGLMPEMDTLTVRTGSGGLHFYYHVTDVDSPEKVIFYLKGDGDVIHLGEMQGRNTFVVAPESTHPNGSKYTVIVDVDINDVKLGEITEPFFEVGCVSALAPIGNGAAVTDHSAFGKAYQKHVTPFRIEDVWDLHRFGSVAPGVYQGPHPVHGSRYGKNLYVDTIRQLWCCYRCRSGGDAMNALAVDAGLIRCDESVRGCLSGKMYGKVGIEALNRGLIK